MPFVTESSRKVGRAPTSRGVRSRRWRSASACCLLGGTAAAFLAYRAFVAERWVDHTLQVRREALDLMTTALAMQGSIRGYLLTEDASFLLPYEAALGRCLGCRAAGSCSPRTTRASGPRSKKSDRTWMNWSTAIAKWWR